MKSYHLQHVNFLPTIINNLKVTHQLIRYWIWRKLVTYPYPTMSRLYYCISKRTWFYKPCFINPKGSLNWLEIWFVTVVLFEWLTLIEIPIISKCIIFPSCILEAEKCRQKYWIYIHIHTYVYQNQIYFV